MITNTLRTELAPFDVKVVTIITGAVSTNNTLSTGIGFKLPETSLYHIIEENISDRARGGDGTPRIQPEVYAEQVVGDILTGANGEIWRDEYGAIVKSTWFWFPKSISVSLFSGIVEPLVTLGF